MSGINKAIIVGRVGVKPEIKYSADGKPIVNLSVATSESWKDKTTGEKKEQTEWHRVSIFGKLAEIAGQYLDKGSQVYIEGKIQTRKWQNKEGQDQYTTEIVLSGFGGVLQMLDSKGDSSPAQPTQHEQAKANGYQPQQDLPNDDIPFR